MAQKKITVFASKSCDGCARAIPAIRKLAKDANRKAKETKVSVKIVDVDNCHTKECNDVKYTPTVKVDGREVSMYQLTRILKTEV